MVRANNPANPTDAALAGQAWITRPATALVGAGTGSLAGLQFAATHLGSWRRPIALLKA